MMSDTGGVTFYRLSTEFQGVTHPLGIDASGEQGEASVMLADSISDDNTQQWTVSSQGDSYYRIQNASMGTNSSLTVSDEIGNNAIQMAETADQSGQLWQITALDNGFCRFTSQLLGLDSSLDVINEGAARQLTMAETGNYSGQHWQLNAQAGTSTDDTLARCTGLETSTELPDSSDDFIATSAYRLTTVQGFELLISPQLDAAVQTATATLSEIEAQLIAIEQALPAAALDELKEVRIWVELDQLVDGGAQYHVSEGWLLENGYNPEKVGGVEISNAANFVNWSQTAQPWMVLHELSHAWQFNHAESNSEIAMAYQGALASGIYESVEYVDGTSERAYALSDDKEYFAELTEAYFGKNDYYPFTHDQLQQFDADGYALIEQVWGVSSSTP
ncbi:RICIN domain-containing protein [Granulosicoccus antarcticus]|nr:RICIN domain-containing protein [Granulosicoccus antarcticus]